MLFCFSCRVVDANLGQSAERYGVDVISIDGFECTYIYINIMHLMLTLSIGAGYPGDDDIGGLVLVSTIGCPMRRHR